MSKTRHTAPRIAAAVAASLLVGASALSAQERAAVDARWLGWIDCWEPTAAPTSTVSIVGQAPALCVVPTSGTSAVEMVTIVDGAIVSRDRVEATATRIPVSSEGCEGWRSAQWSDVGTRLYVRSEATCQGGLTRKSTGMLAMVSIDEWVDVQSVTVGDRTAVRVLRYRQAPSTRAIPEEIVSAVRGRALASGTARLAAAGEITDADLIDASNWMTASVIEAWVLERKPDLSVDARRLVRLSDAGVPESVLDLMIALANQDKFTVNVSERLAIATPEPLAGGGAIADDPYLDRYYDPFWGGYGGYGRYSMFNHFGYGRYGYSPYGYGNWYSQRPVVVVVTPPAGETPSEPVRQGRAVNGRGYTRSTTRTSGSDGPSTRRSSSGDSSGGSSGGSSASGGSGSTSSGSGSSSGRTAKPRPPR